MASEIDTGCHVWFKCAWPCPRAHCHYCDGGLALCIICGAAEGELLSHCPGYKLNVDALFACHRGNVYDFSRLRAMREYDIEAFKDYLKRMRQWALSQPSR
jgi:hypothetical protein